MTDQISNKELSKDPATRIRLLATAAKFSAMLVVLGVSSTILTPNAVADDLKEKGDENELKTSNVDVAALKELLAYAMSSGNMKEAIAKYGKKAKLNEAQIDTLKGLTAEELKDLEMIQKKLDTFDETQFKTRRG